MSDRWWRHKKKRRRNRWFSDVFDEFDRIEYMMDEMMHQAFEPYTTRRNSDKAKSYVYGFTIKTGPDGKPIIKQYGDAKPNRKHGRKAQIREIEEETEPLIDVFEEDKTIAVVAQLPGIEKEDIGLDITETQATISVDTREHSYYKKLQLPAVVDPKTARISYKNGVLQIGLQKILWAKTSPKD